MTPEEINKIPFKFVIHLAAEGFHSTTYKAEGVPFTLMMCHHTPMDEYNEPKGRSTTHFILDGKVYKSKKALYKAMEEL